jgi:transposase
VVLFKTTLDAIPAMEKYLFSLTSAGTRSSYLHWQGTGFILYYKRLEKGTFELPRYDSSVGRLPLIMLL